MDFSSENCRNEFSSKDLGKSQRIKEATGLGLGLPQDATPSTRPARVGGDFAEMIRVIMELPLTAEERAEAVRRLLAER
jgi:hypothetical protein